MFGYCVIIDFRDPADPHYVAPFLSRDAAEKWIERHRASFPAARQFVIGKVVREEGLLR